MFILCVLYVICIYVSIICIGYYRFSILYCILSCIFSKVITCHIMYRLLCIGYYMFNTCKLCSEYLYRVYVMLCYVILCYAMVGCGAVPCLKNFSAQSDPVSFCASDNKRLVTCEEANYKSTWFLHRNINV